MFKKPSFLRSDARLLARSLTRSLPSPACAASCDHPSAVPPPSRMHCCDGLGPARRDGFGLGSSGLGMRQCSLTGWTAARLPAGSCSGAQDCAQPGAATAWPSGRCRRLTGVCSMARNANGHATPRCATTEAILRAEVRLVKVVGVLHVRCAHPRLQHERRVRPDQDRHHAGPARRPGRSSRVYGNVSGNDDCQPAIPVRALHLLRPALLSCDDYDDQSGVCEKALCVCARARS